MVSLDTHHRNTAERTGNRGVRLAGHRNTAERADNRSVRLEQVTGTLRSGLTIGACGLATGVLAGAELKPVIKIEHEQVTQ